MRFAISEFAFAAITAAGAFPLAAQQLPDSLPRGVSAAMVAQGQVLFRGQAICAACHGQDGRGQPGLGPDLADTVRLHGTGSYADILELITLGVPADRSKTGVVMPPRGGTPLTDEHLRAVAAYVWTLGRRQP